MAVVQSRLWEGGTGTSQLAFRQRVCRAYGCGMIFWICRSCDRGQQYCSERCRHKARRQQRREANRRHQQSPEGRLDHRDHQRAYRQRQAWARVTDQGSQTDFSSGTIPPSELTTSSMSNEAQQQSAEETHAGQTPSQAVWDPSSGLVFCVVCGRSGRWIDPLQQLG